MYYNKQHRDEIAKVLRNHLEKNKHNKDRKLAILNLIADFTYLFKQDDRFFDEKEFRQSIIKMENIKNTNIRS